MTPASLVFSAPASARSCSSRSRSPAERCGRSCPPGGGSSPTRSQSWRYRGFSSPAPRRSSPAPSPACSSPRFPFSGAARLGHPQRAPAERSPSGRSWVGFAGVAVLPGFDISGHDLLAVGEIGVCTVGYAVGPMIISASSPTSRPSASWPHRWPSPHWCTPRSDHPAWGQPSHRPGDRLRRHPWVSAARRAPSSSSCPHRRRSARPGHRDHLLTRRWLWSGVTILSEPLRIGAVLGFALILAGSTWPPGATGGRASVPEAREPVAAEAGPPS